LTVEINTITRGIRPGSCMVLRTDVPTSRSIVTDHYLLDLLVLRSRRGLAVSWTPIGPANNCQFRMILKIILKKKE